MLIEIIFALLLGCTAGTFTGLIPGVHVNLISLLLISLPITFISPVLSLVFIVAMTITHTFLDFIPSIFFGSPDEDTGLSVLPGHKLLLKGKGYEAIIYTLYGSCIALIIILISTPFFIFFLPKIYPFLFHSMFLILITASGYLIYKEKNSKLWAFIIFCLAGFLGISSLNLNINQPLLPLLTGLFGGSSLITSIIKKQKIPKQKIKNLNQIKITKKEIVNSSIASILSAPLCAFLPSLGASQAAVIGSDITQEKNKKQFLILLGSINTIVAGLSFITLYSIGKTRTGTSIAINEIIKNLSLTHLKIILITILISGIISFFLTIYISKLIAKNINKFNYKYLSIIILSILTTFSLIFSGFLGLIVFIVSCSLGLTTILIGIRRTHLMGCLMIPTILFYLPF